MKAEPQPNYDVNRECGTDSDNGGWLRRLVRHQRHKNMKPRKTKTVILASAMDALAREIQSNDGVANAAIAEAAQRLRELMAKLEYIAYSELSARHLAEYAKQALEEK